MKIIITLLVLFFTVCCYSQVNVRGWYKNGQVWIVWEKTGLDTGTYAIYSSSNLFTNTTQAALTGRLFKQEWSGLDLKNNANDTNARYRVPLPNNSLDTLEMNEGLFVETVLATGSKYYAVVKYGNTTVNANNRVQVNYTFSLADPPICHLQYSRTNANGYPYKIYCMWADGRDNWWEGRPDFPVMANRYKNGVSHLFIVSEPQGGQGNGRVPAAVFLHGGDGQASQSIPPNRPEINLMPGNGLIIAHNDKMWRISDTTDINFNTWFLGYYKSYNPFVLPPPQIPNDTVINYAQRRIIWMNQWLVQNRNIDSTMISLMGHSVGSAGATMLGKVYPNKFSTVCIFNNRVEGPFYSHTLFGNKYDNLPTNLRDINNNVVRMSQVFDLTTNVSAYRDLPLIGFWHGKNDVNATMGWDSILVKNYRRADSLGYGMRLYWDQRGHGLEQWSGSHWSNSPNPNDQTMRDNASYQFKYRSNKSFPAFYRHAGRPGNYDPGNGNPTNGDLWGTWGGYHDWDTAIVDTWARWEAVCYLVSGYLNQVDSCLNISLFSDISIRKPQVFLPSAGTTVLWKVVRVSTGDTIQSGISIVGTDKVVKAENITVNRYPDKVKIIFINSNPFGITPISSEIPSIFSLLQNYPNPFNPVTNIKFSIPKKGVVKLVVFDAAGREIAVLFNGELSAGTYNYDFDASHLASGIYFYKLEAGEFTQTKKMALVK